MFDIRQTIYCDYQIYDLIEAIQNNQFNLLDTHFSALLKKISTQFRK